MNFSKILLCTDFSEASYQAFKILIADNSLMNTEIRLLYVYQYFPVPVSSPEMPTPLIGMELYEKTRKEIQIKLEDVAKLYFPGKKVIAEAVLSLNTPGDTICRYAQENDSQVIVMASRGHTLLKALFLGSTVQRVLLKTEIPVLVAPVRSE